ncbi:MAG TPA: GatB/YqeY domain-containing protein [Coxiellaceae bacterium]|nr:GatB/YqeY domain-containing protein [Coxiellaceae bacterium]
MSNQNLKQRIHADMVAAMKAKDSFRLGNIRMLQAAIKQREVDERIELNDNDVIAVVNKMIKQRQEAAKQFIDANRSDLAEKENAEISLLQEYMPQALSETEIEQLIQEALKHTQASGIKDMGKVMAHLKEQLHGKADMTVVSAKIKEKLS